MSAAAVSAEERFKARQHTRGDNIANGPPYCCECSEAAHAWVAWPCAGSVLADALSEVEAERDALRDPVRIEYTLQHHLPCKSPDGWVLCICGETFDGPVFHRRHVAALIAAGRTCEPGCGHPRHSVDGDPIDAALASGAFSDGGET